MKDINQLMDTVDAKWELAYTEWQTQIISTDEIEAIVEIFRKQLSALREINTALELMERSQVLMQATFDDATKTALKRVWITVSHID